MGFISFRKETEDKIAANSDDIATLIKTVMELKERIEKMETTQKRKANATRHPVGKSKENAI